MHAENEIKKHLENIVVNLPNSPGVYQYYDKDDKIIYVGKAKNLKRRVSSYFNREQDSPKTRILVRKIANIKYIVVDSEEDALLLENNLIKEYQPRYNVMLKDDKTYPWLCIKHENFPRIVKTRRYVHDGSSYFGPYSSIFILKTLLELIEDLYPIRTCSLNLSPVEIAKGKYQKCLQYHIKKCMAPCVGYQTLADYNQNILDIKEIIKGNVGQIMQHLNVEMKRLSEEYKFEEAQKIKEKYLALENYKCKSTIVSNLITNVDVFSIEMDEASAYINYLHVVSGAIVQAYTVEYKRRMDETCVELLELAIIEIRQRFSEKANEIIVPFELELNLSNVTVTIPSRGEKKKLLDLSIRNVKQYKLDLLKRAEKLNPEQRMMRILVGLQKDLGLKSVPFHIECFDNSNIQGTFPVASCVVFKNAKPSKKDYRHFNIKTVEGPNDFASMEEILIRRYTRLKNEDLPLPQLVIVDGGKGQLSSACQALQKIGVFDKLSIIGIAKRLEEIYFPGDSTPLYLNKSSESLRLIQHLRDEAHRFAITFHRQKRSKGQIQSQLDQITEIGEKTKELLLKKYKSVKQIQQIPLEELEHLIGKHKAKILMNFFLLQK